MLSQVFCPLERKSRAVGQEAKRIRTLRWMCFISICLTAILCGVGSYFALSTVEQNAAVSQFESITDQSFDTIQKTFDRMEVGLQALSKRYSTRYPDLAAWPNVNLPEFYEVEEIVRGLTDFDYFSFNPIVYADKLAGFEQYAFDYWDNDPSIPPNMAGYQSWGRGVFARDATATSTIQITADDKPFTTPVTQISFISNRVSPRLLGFDTHSGDSFRDMVDDILKCVNSSSTVDADALAVECIRASIPTVAFPEKFGNEYTTFQLFAAPILVEDDNVVGYSGGRFAYDTLLQYVVPDYVSTIDVVITIPSAVGDLTFTYRINDGVPIWKGIGDVHISRYSKYKNERKMLLPAKTVEMTLAFYPTEWFFKEYTTDIPIFVAVAVILLISLCCSIFVAYDYAVRGEFVQKDEALDTKRRYVRYSSHEMRRPLNTVRLGLQVLEIEFDDLLRDVANSFSDVNADTVTNIVSEWMEVLKDMLGNSHAAMDMLNDLLNYDEIEACTLRLDFSWISISDILRKTAQSFALQTRQGNTRLILKGPLLCDGGNGRGPDHITIFGRNFEQNTNGTGGTRAAEVDDANGRADMWEEGEQEMNDTFRGLSVLGDITRLRQVLRKLLSDALKSASIMGTVVVTADVLPDGLPGETKINIPVQNFGSTLNSSSSVESRGDDGVPSSIGLHCNPRAGAVRIVVQSYPVDSHPRIATANEEKNQETHPSPTNRNSNNNNTSDNSNLNSNNDIEGEAAPSTSMVETIPLNTTNRTVEGDIYEQRDGNGRELGLFISKGIIEEHGGTVMVEYDQTGAGLTYSVLLPLFQRDTNADALSYLEQDQSTLTSVSADFEIDDSMNYHHHYRPLNESQGEMDMSVGLNRTAGGILPQFTAGKKSIILVDPVASSRKLFWG